MAPRRSNCEKGFTLIELLVVTSIIGVLASLAISSYQIYKSNAAYGVSEKTLRDARTAFEGGITGTESDPAAVPLYAQNTAGSVTNANAAALLPGMQIPRNTKLQVYFDPTCTNAACEQGRLQVDHCHALDATRWTVFGDGVEIELDRIAGSNCH